MAATATARDYSRGVVVAAIIATAAEAASNAVFAYERGGHFVLHGWPVDSVVLALTAVAIAVFQARAATLLYRDGVQLVPALFLVACVAYSAGAMSAHILKLQRLQADHDAAGRRGLTLAERELADAEAAHRQLLADRDALANPRPVAEIKAALDAADVPAKVFRRSNSCTDITQDATRDACKPVTDLRQELGRAYRAAEIGPEIEAATARVVAARKRLAGIVAPAEPSPHEKLLAQYLPWLMAGVIELTATFGFALAYRPAPRAPRRPAAPEPPPTPGPTPSRRRLPAGTLDVPGALDRIRSGGLDVPGARIGSDGWVELSQRSLGEALGVSASTVNAHVAAAVASGRIASRRSGRTTALKTIYPPISTVK